MKATTSTQFNEKFNQTTIRKEHNKSSVQNKSIATPNHRDLVVNEVQDLLKWAYDQNT